MLAITVLYVVWKAKLNNICNYAKVFFEKFLIFLAIVNKFFYICRFISEFYPNEPLRPYK